MALTQISTQGIKDGTITGSDLATNIDLVDDQKLRLGTGNDLQIYHDGSHSYIQDTGTGELRFTSNTYKFYNAAFSETLIEAFEDGAVNLYYDGTKKFETTTAGAEVTGTLRTGNGSTISFSDNVNLEDSSGSGNNRIKLGLGDDLQIYHNGSNSFIQDQGTGNLYIDFGTSINLRKYEGGGVAMETVLKGTVDGAVELYHNNSKKFQTVSNGAQVIGSLGVDELYMGDNEQIKIGAEDDFLIYHGGSENVLDGVLHKIELRHGSEKHLVANPDGAVELYHDNSQKMLTSSTGINVNFRIAASGDENTYVNLGNPADQWQFYTGGVDRLFLTGGPSDTGTVQIRGDNNKLQIGASQDLEIYHDGSDSYISQTGTGNLILQGNASNNIAIRAKSGEEGINLIPNGAVELYYDNSKKFETTNAGGTLHGELNATGANFTDDGQSSPIVSVLADDNNPWGIQVGNSTYSNNAQHGWQVYVNNSGEVFNYNIGSSTYNDWNWYLSNSSASKQMMKFESSTLAVELYHDNVKQFETHDDGVVLNGLNQATVAHGQYDNLVLGNAGGNAGLTIVSGTNNAGTVAWADGSSGAGQYRAYLEYYHDTERMHLAVNTSVAMEWRTDQIISHEHINPSANNTYDLGSASVRWRNIYTNDLNLSNEGSSNDVDGTWGSFTIQEGAEDLFLVNKRNGKKYKFNLTEVQ